jgi:excisionase family DNA binding protein
VSERTRRKAQPTRVHADFTPSLEYGGPILNSAQACALLGISEPKLRELMAVHGLPSVRLGPQTLRFIRADVEGWVRDLARAQQDHPLREAC